MIDNGSCVIKDCEQEFFSGTMIVFHEWWILSAVITNFSQHQHVLSSREGCPRCLHRLDVERLFQAIHSESIGTRVESGTFSWSENGQFILTHFQGDHEEHPSLRLSREVREPQFMSTVCLSFRQVLRFSFESAFVQLVR